MKKQLGNIVLGIFVMCFNAIAISAQYSGGVALSSKFITQDALFLGDESLQIWTSSTVADTITIGAWANIGDYDELDLSIEKQWLSHDLLFNTKLSYFSIPGDTSIVVPELSLSRQHSPWYFKTQHWNFTSLSDEDGMTYAIGYNEKWLLKNSNFTLIINGESKYIDRSRYDRGWIALLDVKFNKNNYYIGTRIGHNRLNKTETHLQLLIGLNF